MQSRDGAPVVALCVLEDGRAVSGTTRGALQLWNLAAGEWQRDLEGHRGRITAIRAVNGGRTVVSLDERRHLRVWDLDGQRCRAHIDYGDHDDNVFLHMAVNDDGTRAFSINESRRGFVWDLVQGSLIRQLELELVLAGSGVLRTELAPDSPETAYIELESGWVSVGLDGAGSPRPATPGTDLLYRGSHHSYQVRLVDERVVLYDHQSGEELLVLDGHVDSLVLSAAIAPDASMVVSGDDEGNIRVWQLDWV